MVDVRHERIERFAAALVLGARRQREVLALDRAMVIATEIVRQLPGLDRTDDIEIEETPYEQRTVA